MNANVNPFSSWTDAAGNTFVAPIVDPHSTGGVVTMQAAQVVAIGSTSAASAAVQAGTTRVILTTTADCWVAFGSTPTAVANTTGNIFLPAGVPSYPIAVTPGVTKIAVIQATSVGYLSIVESA